MGQELNGSLGSLVTLSDPFPALLRRSLNVSYNFGGASRARSSDIMSLDFKKENDRTRVICGKAKTKAFRVRLAS